MSGRLVATPVADAAVGASSLLMPMASANMPRLADKSMEPDDDARQRSTTPSMKPSSPTDFCQRSEKRAVDDRGMLHFSSSSKRIRTGKVTPSPNAMASRWPRADRNSNRPAPVSEMAEVTISWSRSLDMRSEHGVAL